MAAKITETLLRALVYTHSAVRHRVSAGLLLRLTLVISMLKGLSWRRITF